jgi:hypothetical protein
MWIARLFRGVDFTRQGQKPISIYFSIYCIPSILRREKTRNALRLSRAPSGLRHWVVEGLPKGW